MSPHLLLATIDGLVLAVIGVLLWLTPALTRRDLFFGVTVAPNARSTPAGRAITTRYRIAIALITLVGVLAEAALVLLGMSLSDIVSTLAAPILLLVWLLPLSAPYLWAHNAARALAAAPSRQAHGEQATPIRPSRRPYGVYLSWGWELIPLALIVCTVAYLALTYAHAPATIPLHWNASGVVDRYGPKTFGSYFLTTFLQVVIYLLLFGAGYLITLARPQGDNADLPFRRNMLILLLVIRTLVVALLGALAFSVASQTLPGWFILLPLAIIFVVLGGMVIFALSTGQGGARLRTANAAPTDRTADRYWKLGVIYVNPDDPAILVERRFGIGYTLNFGSPRAVVVLIAIVAVPLALVLGITLLTAR